MDISKISKSQIFLILFFISLLIYANSLYADFLLDDKILIVNNEYIKHIKSIPLLFVSHAFKFAYNSFELSYSYYRPLQTLSFAINYFISRLNPFGYHLTNIIIHSINAFLVFYFIYRLFSNFSLAFLSCILFCVHPIHTESVSYISGRSELLVSFFTLLSLISYIRYLDFHKGLLYLISLLSFVSALLSREAPFLIFVPIFILIMGLKSTFPKRSVLIHFISFAGILAIYITLRLTILVPIQLSPRSSFPLLLDVLNFSRVLIEYINLLIFPYSLHIFRSIASISSYRSIHIVLPVLFLISLIIILFVSIKQKKYALLFGISWFVLTLIYLIKFMYKFSERIITMEEHWAYLASLGFFVVLAYFILSINRKKLIMIVSIVIIVLYGGLTIVNSGHWKNEIDFYYYNIKFIEPSLGVIPRLNLSTALSERGLYKEALDEANFILAIEPESWMAYIQLGDIFRDMKKFTEAKAAYKNALEIDYFCWQANRRLKLLAEKIGEPFKDELDPSFSPAEIKIVSLIRIGDFDQALTILEEALSVSPTPQFYTLLGITLGKIGLNDRAMKAFNYALDIDPNYYLALYNLAIIYENKRDHIKADQIRKKLSR